MNFETAKAEATKILGEGVSLDTRNGVRRVLKGDQVLGAGPSWKAALRRAVKPVLQKSREEETEARNAEMKEMMELRKDREEFYEFLREYLGAPFDTWKARQAAAAEQVVAPPEAGHDAPADNSPSTP